jgi:hypothetical protein
VRKTGGRAGAIIADALEAVSGGDFPGLGAGSRTQLAPSRAFDMRWRAAAGIADSDRKSALQVLARPRFHLRSIVWHAKKVRITRSFSH